MEFLALILLAPLIWTGAEGSPTEPSSDVPSAVATVAASTAPRIETEDGRWSISPPLDSSLTMTVLEHKLEPKLRGPASVETGFRRIDVIVSAP